MADTASPIKSDPDLSPSPMIDDEDDAFEDDAFEDTGELEMPKQLPRAWMIKVPKMIYERWSDISDDEPIRIGTLKRYQSGRTKVVLDSSGQAAKYNRQIPLEYEMREGTNHGNTFMFSEKDIPGSRRRNYKRDPAPANGVSKKEIYRAWRSRTVPKQTKLAAAATHEAQWYPVENAQYYSVMPKSILSDRKGENEMQMLQGDPVMFSGTILGNGRKKQDGGFDKFVGPAPITKTQKKRKEKAIRIPPDQMLDLLFDAFQDYDYYRASTLRARIRQPETYIREMLGQIATLITTGDYAGTWRLNGDMRRTKGSAAHGGMAPKIKEEDLPSELDVGTDDDNLEMEDVKP